MLLRTVNIRCMDVKVKNIFYYSKGFLKHILFREKASYMLNMYLNPVIYSKDEDTRYNILLCTNCTETGSYLTCITNNT